jgi:hypothetical protein
MARGNVETATYVTRRATSSPLGPSNLIAALGVYPLSPSANGTRKRTTPPDDRTATVVPILSGMSGAPEQ